MGSIVKMGNIAHTRKWGLGKLDILSVNNIVCGREQKYEKIQSELLLHYLKNIPHVK